VTHLRPSASPEHPAAYPTAYTVTCLPDETPDANSWELTVEYRGRGLWAIKRWSNCLSRNGEWDYEHIPSEREDEWLAEHRFPLEEALELAKKAAPDVIVNGMTAADVLAWHAAGCPLPIPRPHSRARAAGPATRRTEP
jgi:hypothetical protein